MTARGFLAGLAIAGAFAIGGCAGGPGAHPDATPRVTCTGLPSAKCDEAVASVARSLPNVQPALIEVGCVSPPCTAASGAMVTTVTLADGHKLTGSTQVWSDPAASGGGGGPVPVPSGPGQVVLPVEPVCQGVPLPSCRDMAGTAIDQGHGAVVSIIVRCTRLPCTETSGEGDTTVAYADGTRSTVGWVYSDGG